LLDTFLRLAKAYLNTSGYLLLGFSEKMGDMVSLYGLAAKYEWKV